MAALSFEDIPDTPGQGQVPAQAPAQAPAQSRGPLSFDDIQVPAQAAPAAAQQGPPAAPWYAQAGQAADDLARLAAGGATFGYADKLAGYLSGTGTEAERARTAAAAQRAGGAGTIAELGGAAATTVALGGAGLSLGRGIPAAANNIATRTLASGVEGAGYGALSASGHDQDIATGAKIGALAGAAAQPVAEVLSPLIKGTAGLFNKKPPLPTAADLKSQSGAAYEAMDRAGVIVKPDFVQDLSTRIRTKLANEGYSPNLHTGVTGVLNEIDNAIGQNTTLKGVENMRRIASDLSAMRSDPASARLGGIMKREVDDALENMNLSHLLTGNKTEGVQALREARSLWRDAKKTELVETALRNAEDQAAASGTGGNMDNAIRQQFKALQRSPQTRSWTADEKAALSDVIRADTFDNMMRHAGRLAPNAGMLQAAGTLGAVIPSGGASLLGSGAAMGAKAIADTAAQNRVYGLARVIANGGAAPPAIQNAVQRLPAFERETLSKILMSWGVQGGQDIGLGAALP